MAKTQEITLVDWKLNYIPKQSIDCHSSTIKVHTSEIENKSFYKDIEVLDNKLTLYRLHAKIKMCSNPGRRVSTHLWASAYHQNILRLNHVINRSPSISGTQDWASYSIDFFAPSNTKRIQIGGCAQGDGVVWFSDFKLATIEPAFRASAFSQEVSNYLEEIIDIIDRKALHRNSLNIDDVRKIIKYYASEAQAIAEVHNLMPKIIPLLADHHSTFMSQRDVKELLGLKKSDLERIKQGKAPNIIRTKLNSLRKSIPYSTAKIVGGSIGYLSIPSFDCIYEEGMRMFADSLQRSVQEIDQRNVQGWIVDMRNNYGGVVVPMITGIGPLLDNANVVYFVDANHHIVSSLSYCDGRYNEEDFETGKVSTIFRSTINYRLLNENLPTAVLTGPHTASSAEVVVAAFAGQSNVKIFGSKTNGLSTSNSFHILSDYSVLNLTFAYLANRLHEVYERGIFPDIEVSDDPLKRPVTSSSVLGSAIKWIRK